MMLPSKATRKHREKALFNSRVLSKFCNLLYMCTTDYRLLYMSYVLNEIWTVLQTAFGMLCKVIWLKILVEANLEGRDVGKEEKRKRKIALKKAPNRQKEFPSPYSCRNRVHSEPDDQMTALQAPSLIKRLQGCIFTFIPAQCADFITTDYFPSPLNSTPKPSLQLHQHLFMVLRMLDQWDYWS